MVIVPVYKGNLDIFLTYKLFGQIHACKSTAYDHNFHPDIIFDKGH